jgi:phage-related protein (TIGR01555 family)
MTQTELFTDGLTSLTANLGTSRDKASTLSYERPELSDEQILNAYRGSWLPKKIVDIPALDSCRKWRAWQADKPTITAIEAEEERLDVKRKVLEARKKARLFGGSAVYFATGDEDVSLPLSPDRIAKGGVKHLTVMTRRNLMAGDLDIDPMSPGYGEPSYYQITSNSKGLVRIHPSRLIRFHGSESPTEISAGSQSWSWGDSVLLSTLKAIKDADGTAANIASLVFEAKVDVFKIPGLMAKIRDKRYESDLLTRFAIAAAGKGNNGALILDGDEDYVQKTMSFASLPDVLDSFLQIVSGAADIPATRLLGQSPAGMNATGESDIRNYYDRIQSSQELEIQPAMRVFDECLIRSATGARDADIHYIWRSLWQTSEKERSEIGKQTADTIKTLKETELFPDEVLSKTAVNMLTENGVAPGLEGEMNDFTGETLPEAVESGVIDE